MTIAQLGLAVDSGPVERAIPNLDKLTASAKAADGAADQLAGGARAAGTAVGQLGASADVTAAAEARATASSRMHTAAIQAQAQASRLLVSQRANLIFQLNDIGVSLASGMNPLLVAVQQGSQISTIYGPGGLGKALSETGKIAGNLLTRLAPVAGIVALLGTGVATLTTEINRGQKVQVSFFDVLTAGWELAWESFVKVAQPLTDWFAGVWDEISPYIATGMNVLIGSFDLAFRNIKTIWSMLPAALGDVAISTANSVIKAMEDMINGGLKLLNDFIVEANKLLPEGLKLGTVGQVDFAEFTNPNAGADKALAAQMRKNAEDVRKLSLGGGYTDALGERSRQVAGRLSPEEMKKAQQEAKRMAEAYSDLTRSSQQFIEEQEREARALGMTREEASRLRHTQEVLNKAANDNIKLTPKQTRELEGLAAAMAAAEEQTKRLTEIYDFGKEVFGGFFGELKSNLREGQGLWDALGGAALSALDKIAEKALSMAADGIWDMLFGAVMGGLGSIGGFKTAGGLNGGTGGFIGSVKYSANGNVFGSGISGYSNQVVDRPTVFPFANGIGLMGEAGPEAVMPLRRGPDGRLGVQAANSNRPGAANSNGQEIIRIVLQDDSGRMADIAEQTVRTASGAIVKVSVAASEKRFMEQAGKGKYRSVGVSPGLKRT